MNLIQRIDRFIDRVTEWIYERCRDHTRDELCIALQGLGINAQMSERGRPEEEITSRWFESLMLGVKYLGIIEVQNPMIRWVGVKKHNTRDKDGYGEIYYEIEYGIPYSTSSHSLSKVRIRTKHNKRNTMSGKVIDLKWEGKDFGLGLIENLNHDVLLKKPLMDIKEDLVIRYYHKHSCWILTTGRVDISADLWDCYQGIARRLLGS